MKKEYIAPELEVVSFTTEDIITVSGGNDAVVERPLPGGYGDQP